MQGLLSSSPNHTGISAAVFVMPKLFYIVLGFLFVLVIATVVLIAQFGVWGAVIMALLLAGLFYAGYLAAGRSVKRLLMAPFLARGAVLRNAKAQVHHVREARRQNVADLHRRKLADDPDADDEDNPPELPRNLRYFNVDVTIRPTSPARSFARWDPNELLLVPFRSARDSDSEDPAGYVEHWEIFFESRFIEPGEAEKTLEDRQRVKLLFAVPEQLRRVKFEYFGHCFGDLELSEPRPEIPEDAATAEQETDAAPTPAVDPDEARGRPVDVSTRQPSRPIDRRKQKNRVKNTQRLNLSLLAEQNKGKGGRSASDEDDDLSVPPWAAGKSGRTNGGPKQIVVPDEDDDWEDDEGSYRGAQTRVTNRINIPPAPRFDDDEGAPREEKPVPVPAGGSPEPEPEPEDTPSSAAGGGGGSSHDFEEPAAPVESRQKEDTSQTERPASEKSPGEPGTRENPVKPLQAEPQEISARSTAVKQSTLTQRLMALSQGKAAGETGENADEQETQPWQKPKHPEMLKEPEPAPAKPQPAQETPRNEAQPQPEGRKFFVARDGKPTGPYSMADVRQLVENGSITEKDHAWTEGLPYWVTVASILYNYR